MDKNSAEKGRVSSDNESFEKAIKTSGLIKTLTKD